MSTRSTKTPRKKSRHAAAGRRDQRRAVRKAREQAALAELQEDFDRRRTEQFKAAVGREPEPHELDRLMKARPQTSDDWARLFTTLGYSDAVGRAVHEVGYAVFAEVAHLFTDDEVQAFQAALDRHTTPG